MSVATQTALKHRKAEQLREPTARVAPWNPANDAFVTRIEIQRRTQKTQLVDGIANALVHRRNRIDALDREILLEANVQTAGTVVAVTDDDEVNILASLLAKKNGCRRAVTLVNNAGYGSLISSLGIDAAVNPRATTVSTILQHVRRGRIRGVHTLKDGMAEVIEAEALETSVMVGRPLRETRLPPGVVIGAEVRGDTVIIPRGDTVIQAKDRVVIFALAEAVRKVEKMFSVRLDFF